MKGSSGDVAERDEQMAVHDKPPAAYASISLLCFSLIPWRVLILS
jgi:hypothetical protein